MITYAKRVLQHFDCPFCNMTLQFDVVYSHDHNNLLRCMKCNFMWVQDCVNYANNLHNLNYARLLQERKLTSNMPTGTLLPLGIIGYSMFPTLVHGAKYIMQIINNDMNNFIDGAIYSIILNGKPMCCRVYASSHGFHLHKDNSNYGDMLVGCDDVMLVGRVLINE